MPHLSSPPPLATRTATPGQPHQARHSGATNPKDTATRLIRHSMLPASLSGHQIPSAAVILLIGIFLISAVLAITLVSMTSRDDRVDAIHATAEILRALLPWSPRQIHARARPGPADGPVSPDQAANKDSQPGSAREQISLPGISITSRRGRTRRSIARPCAGTWFPPRIQAAQAQEATMAVAQGTGPGPAAASIQDPGNDDGN